MKQREGGFVSLMACIIISLLLMALTMAMVTQQIAQLRKAEDSEQALRAYYAAEAGVEDAASKVVTGAITATTGANTCHNGSSFDTPGAAGWTCQFVSFTGAPSGKLKTEESKTIDTGSQPYTQVAFEWNQSGTTSASYYNAANVFSGGNWNNYNSAPPLEVQVVEYPPGGFAAQQICTRPGVPAGCVASLENMVLVPAGPAVSGLVPYSSLLGGGPKAANCDQLGRSYAIGTATNTGYNCYAFLTGLNPAKSYLFRIRPRYAGTTFRMTFLDPAGAQVDVPDGMATIDVTAKAGQASRRVVYKIPLTAGAAPQLNYVLYSDGDVCKNFNVVNDVVAGGICP